MSWKLLLIGGGLGLMGCVEQTGFADPPLVPSQIRSEATMPPAFGISTIPVRAFVTEAGATREVTGATCELTSPYSTASFAAPATVSVPDLGNQTPVVRVRCAEGGRSGAVEARAELRTLGGGGGWPMIGVSVGTGGYSGVSVGGLWTGGGNASANAWRAVYPDVQVMMR